MGPVEATAQLEPFSPSVQSRATLTVDATVVSTQSLESFVGVPHLVSVVERSDTGERIAVEVPGGVTGDLVQVTFHQPILGVGDNVRLALLPAPAGEAASLSAQLDAPLAVFSVVGGSDGVQWSSGIERNQMQGVTSMLSGDFNYFPAPNGQPFKWASFSPAPVYKINTSNNSGLTTAQVINNVTAGAQIWEDDPGSTVNYEYGGTTTASGVVADFNNTVSFVATPNPADDFLAQATFWATNNQPNKIAAFDIIFNRDYQFGINPAGTPGRYDVATVALHEFGHTLGLAHVDEDGDQNEIMYPTGAPGVARRVPRVGDTQGIRGLYGDPRPQTCGGFNVTVDLAIGQQPTQNRDIIVGTNQGETINALGGNDVVCARGGADIVNGGPGNDVIYGMSGPDTLNGQVGDDQLLGASEVDTLVGGTGDDLLKGGPGDDTLYGGDGADILIGEDGNDIAFGQDGPDKVYGQAGQDSVHGDAGNDVVVGGVGLDTVTGGPGDDTMFGVDHADVMIGGAGNDIISGGSGNDDIQGNDGEDVLAGDTGDDILDGGPDNDDLRGGPDNDTLIGGAGNDLLRAAFGDDILNGGGGNDLLFGQDGDDEINGGAASDQMFGGNGFDTCRGQGGAADSETDCEAVTGVP